MAFFKWPDISIMSHLAIWGEKYVIVVAMDFVILIILLCFFNFYLLSNEQGVNNLRAFISL
jgi:hypothetical protein